jgi:F-type H+-transporting ATPase subunit delta
MIASISRRYARALDAVCADRAELEAVCQQLGSLRDAIDGSAELRDLLFNPAFDRSKRHQAITALAPTVGLGPIATNLAHLLIDRNRFDQIGGIARSLSELADEAAGRARASVVSASPIPETLFPRLEQALAGALDRQVVIDRSVDPSLLGGVVAQVGSLRFDGSTRTQLETLRRELKQA